VKYIPLELYMNDAIKTSVHQKVLAGLLAPTNT
jgi:hypothetical protein